MTAILIPGCSIAVVRVLWEHVVWVRLPAARHPDFRFEISDFRFMAGNN
jgi:hypothetical protein